MMGMEEFQKKTLGPSCEGNATTYRGSEKGGESEGNKVVFVECEFFCARCHSTIPRKIVLFSVQS